MKEMLKYSLFFMLTLLIAGCDLKEEDSIAEIVSITPSDGTTRVIKNTAIQVEFSEPMDIESCESRFSLHMGEHTSMVMMMEGLHGQFEWNGSETMMTYHPDSMLMDSTVYSICLKEGMRTHHHGGEMMMSNMMGHGMETNDGIISHFTTE